MNLKDIAQKAQVSISTVSRIINNSANVNESKRERVIKVMKQGDYVPNSIARSLASKTTHTIGIMTPDVRHLNCAPIAYNVERIMNRRNYTTVLCNTGLTTATQLHYLKSLVSRKIDGLVLIGANYNREEIGEAIDKYLPDTPIVMLNGMFSKPNITNVFGSSDEAVVKIINYLHDLGHRRIVFVKEIQNWIQNMKEELFFKSMREKGVELGPEYVFLLDKSRGIQALARYLEEDLRDYTAIIANNDLVACGVIKYLKEYGKRVPEDVSVVGYHNLEYGTYFEPALTTIDNFPEIMGEVIANALLDSINGKPAEREIRTSVDLIVRDSATRINQKFQDSMKTLSRKRRKNAKFL